MPPRPNLRLSRPLQLWLARRPRALPAVRSFADHRGVPPEATGDNALGRLKQDDDGAKGPNEGQMPHVSEEAAAMSKVKGEEGVDVTQGTRVEEVVKGDKEAQKVLPKVMQQAIKAEEAKKGSRSFSTAARRSPSQAWNRSFSTAPRRRADNRPAASSQGLHDGDLELVEAAAEHMPASRAIYDGQADPHDTDAPLSVIERRLLLHEHATSDVVQQGHKFGLPEAPLPVKLRMKKRYDPVVEQVTKLMMRDGKLATAQRNMADVLAHLRTSPAPQPSSRFALVASAPPAATLPLNPEVYLQVVLDSVAPLFRMRSQKGLAGGGVALQLPVPLAERARRRQAAVWLLDAVARRKGAVSGFAKRFAEEIVAAAEGRSAACERRNALHGLGVRSRANLNVAMARRR